MNSKIAPRILIVEDEMIVAMDIENGLKQMGYIVVDNVDSGEEAIAAAEKHMPDLALMDVQIKGELSGIETATIIRNNWNIPVIFLTAYADEATLEKSKKAQAYGYLLKPFEETELHTAIEIVLEKHKRVEDQKGHYIKELSLSEARLKLLLDSISDYAIFMLDIKGNVISWSKGATKLIGYTADEVLGKNIALFYTEEDREKSFPKYSLDVALKDGQYVEEAWRVRKDGSLYWAHDTIGALYDKTNLLIGFSKVVHDMTQKKLAEDLLKKTIKTRDEFISIASHELKTPLTSMFLNAQSFERARKKNDQKIYQKENIDKLVDQNIKQIKRLKSLIEDMLEISKIRSGKFTMEWTRFELRAVVNDLIERMTPQFLEAGCGRPELLAPEVIVGVWDKGRIEQIFNNLFINAIKYAKGKPLKVKITKESKAVLVEIIDQGIGIEKSKHYKIFERFERATNIHDVSGMGLGLYICKEIVEAHQGEIWVESELGKGATFKFRLPLVPETNRRAKVEVSLIP